MAEKIILSADLYDNAVTERKGDYAAKARITGTIRNSEIADRILARGSEFRKDTIEHILKMADEEKVTAIAQGKSVIDGLGQYLITISGVFEGEKAPFESAKHKLGVSFTTSQLMRNTMKNISVDTSTASTGPVINSITDSTTGEKDQTLTSGSAAVISGVNIKVMGEDPANGVFFTKTDGTPLKASLLIHNNPSELTVIMPVMATGEYTLSITTQYSTNNKLVKESRTYTFPVLLTTQGGGSGEKPEDL